MKYELKYTESKNIPYIEISDIGRISFVLWSSEDVGYKHTLFSFNHGLNLSFLANTKFEIPKNEYKRDLKRLGVLKNINKIGHIAQKYVNSDDIFPYVKLDKLANDLAKMTFDVVDVKSKDKVPIKRTRRKKKTTKK